MRSLKGIGLIVLAFVFALLAAFAATVYIRTQAASPAKHALVPIVVASQDLTFGTKLEREKLQVVSFPKESVPTGAYADIDSVIGQTTKVFLVRGEPILAMKLSSAGGGLSVRIPEAMRASSVSVDDVSGVSGFILPGDRIDVIATIDNVGGPGNTVSKIILQDVEVLAAGVKTETKNSKPVNVQTVTLLVDPHGAEDLALALHQAKLHLALRNPVDRSVSDIEPVNTKEVIGRGAGSFVRAVSEPLERPVKPKAKVVPAVQTTIEPLPVAPPAPVEPTYTVIRNGKIEQQKPTGMPGANTAAQAGTSGPGTGSK